MFWLEQLGGWPAACNSIDITPTSGYGDRPLVIRFRRLRVPWARDPRDPSAGLAAPEMGEIAAPSGEFAEASRVSQTFRAFQHRNYRLYYGGQAISLSGTWMQTVAQSVLVLQMTDSPEALGVVTMLQFLPITLFVLFAGVIADRVPKRNFIIATQALAMFQALALTVLVWSGHVHLWHVYALAALLGVSNAMDQPTRQAFVVEMVGKDDLMNAVALNAGMFNGARLIGPSIGGLIIAATGVKVAFLLNAISFIPVVGALLAMDMAQMYGGARKEGRVHPLAELREGLSFAFRTPAVLHIVILGFFIGMFGYNFIVVLPLVAKYLLGGGSVELGFLWAALGSGALVSALTLASRRSATKFTLYLGGAVFAITLLGTALSPWFFLTLAVLWPLGVSNLAFATTANTTIQVATPDHLRGRVMGLWMLLFAGSTPVGGFLTGYLAEHLGVSEAIAFNAAMCGIGLTAGALYYITHRAAILRTADASQPAAMLATEAA